MDEISKAQEKVLMDVILETADCISQADYERAATSLYRSIDVLNGLNNAAYPQG